MTAGEGHVAALYGPCISGQYYGCASGRCGRERPFHLCDVRMAASPRNQLDIMKTKICGDALRTPDIFDFEASRYESRRVLPAGPDR